MKKYVIQIQNSYILKPLVLNIFSLIMNNQNFYFQFLLIHKREKISFRFDDI